jgi:hypothetical protein
MRLALERWPGRLADGRRDTGAEVRRRSSATGWLGGAEAAGGEAAKAGASRDGRPKAGPSGWHAGGLGGASPRMSQHAEGDQAGVVFGVG